MTSDGFFPEGQQQLVRNDGTWTILKASQPVEAKGGPCIVLQDSASSASSQEQSSPRQDRALIRGVLSGRSGSIDALVIRLNCVPGILAARNRILGRPLDPEELDDLVQDALVVVWRKLDAFTGVSSLESWVYRICVLEMMNAIRAKRRRPVAAPEALRQVCEDPMAEQGAPLFGSERLHSGLDRLGPPGSDIIRLKHFEQLTFDEISERTGQSVNTIKSQYYRGLRRLRGILGSVPREEEIS